MSKSKSHLHDLEAHPLKKWMLSFVRSRAGVLLKYLFTSMLAMFVVLLIVQKDFNNNWLEIPPLGTLSKQVIRSPKNFEIIDQYTSEVNRQKLLYKIPTIFDHDDEALHLFEVSVRDFLKSLNTTSGNVQIVKRNIKQKQWNLDSKTLEVFIKNRKNANLYKLVDHYFNISRKKYFISSLANFKDSFAFEISNLKTGRVHYINHDEISDFVVPLDGIDAESLIFQEKELQRLMLHSIKGKKYDAFEDKKIVVEFLLSYTKPNIFFNLKLVEERKNAALKNFEPVIHKISKGEILVQRGQRVSQEIVDLFEKIKNAKTTKSSVVVFIKQWLFGTFVFCFVLMFLKFNYPAPLMNRKDNAVAFSMVVVSLALFKIVLMFMVDVMSDYFMNIPSAFFLFLIPVAAPAMILRFLLSPAMAILATILYSISTNMILGDQGFYGVFVLLSGMAAAFFSAQVKTRAEIHRVGLWTALITGFAALFLFLSWTTVLNHPSHIVQYFIENSERNLIWIFLGGALSGWISASLAMVFTPFLENLLEYTTDLKLLELARMDHPLLKELAMKAPGTYHHCIVVGTLAEAAAEAIGANALLAKVGAHYHDIGKMLRPEYFTENQNGVNKHDMTSPQLSAKIIISHVKDGVILAKKFKLGQPIIDMIEQHHGQSVVKYFYNKAQQEAAQPDSEEIVEENQFQYPGPKPTYKEVVIVALADSCEAATRSLVEPTPARIRGMIHKIVFAALQEGVLSRAQITLVELTQIEEAFVRVLMSIHHHRIQYPDQEKDLPQDQKSTQLLKLGRS